ncbi:DNA polymerase III subunit delta [Iocasia frigidifontis]|uniref:DNA polymerase III subunit delta n=1 Tax=Iocasia fonsfrigidae TaxID=2682810 RepID=A0A8A7K879_9FIRM|nr:MULTISPECIES: DNA polymerase III subunit delta [Halanaerobiaceae]AZO94990.1 DNA polymerase III subunit delta [Halocella sp. SP3-1]MTI61263.1 DNA polymerase III subunit delta [Bacillota bacterium]QTL97946.1 DNA polymerase III subunit delta [Iocasia fonsfrigidae]
MKDIKEILNKSIDELKPIYLIYSEEIYLLNKFKEAFTKKYIPDEIKDFNLTVIKNTENLPVLVKNQANTPPFMTEKRFIIIEPGEYFKNKNSEDRFLIELFNNFPQTTQLLFLINGKIDKRLKVVKEIKKNGEIIELESPKYKQLDKWIEREFARYNKKIDKRSINMLENMFQNNLQLLENEIGKIVLYKHDEEKINYNDISNIISKDRLLEDNLIFAFTDAIIGRNNGKAITILNEMLNDGAVPLKILSTVIWQLRLLLSVKELKKKGKDIRDISRILKVHQYPVKKCYSKADVFTDEELEIMLERFMETNYQIVTGKYEAALALEMAIVK